MQDLASEHALEKAEQLQRIHNQVTKNLEKAAENMKRQADKKQIKGLKF